MEPEVAGLAAVRRGGDAAGLAARVLDRDDDRICRDRLAELVRQHEVNPDVVKLGDRIGNERAHHELAVVAYDLAAIRAMRIDRARRAVLGLVRDRLGAGLGPAEHERADRGTGECDERGDRQQPAPLAPPYPR